MGKLIMVVFGVLATAMFMATSYALPEAKAGLYIAGTILYIPALIGAWTAGRSDGQAKR